MPGGTGTCAAGVPAGAYLFATATGLHMHAHSPTLTRATGDCGATCVRVCAAGGGAFNDDGGGEGENGCYELESASDCAAKKCKCTHVCNV